ncbi:protein ELC-like [Primulina eburnea]|uniref:protein ELC-like n=1 Tax=Primulina eburnea TaxID=1245227 RepID=UPI003C6CB2EB
MSISFDNSIRYIEDALFCNGPMALSYTDPDKKWIIREHFISIFQDFPSFKPSIGTFTHNDGTEVTLLNANGELCVSKDAPSVPLTIWIHEHYPQRAPMVYVESRNSMYPIYHDHPFVDSSGATTSSYLENWLSYKCDLSDLVRNLIKLFSYNHPFYYSGVHGCAHPSMVSKMEAMDRLKCAIFYDMKAITAKNEEETMNLSALHAELERRGKVMETGISELELEKKCLSSRTMELDGGRDRLLNWIKFNDKNNVLDGEIDDMFEGLDKKSNLLIDLGANDLALEDLMYALDRAVEEGVASFEVYIKQVRILAREQFFCKAKINKIESETKKNRHLLL